MKFFALYICLLVAAVSAKPSINSRIVGGVDAEPHAYPYQISFRLEIPSMDYDSHVCGGAILNENWVLTAAHCISEMPNLNITQLSILAGRHNISMATEPNQQYSVVKTYYIHEDYEGALAPNDIALVELETPLVFDEYVQPINLPTSGYVSSGIATITGWGSISNNSARVFPDILQTVSIPIIPFDVCKDLLTSLGFGDISPTNLCTGPLTGEYAPCSGDSGGPLTENGEVIGILSWGFVPCGSVDRPSVYVAVSEYVNWINEIIN